MKNNTRQITLIALFLALSIVVPMFFHMIGAGAMFLPMFIPIILAGFLIEFPYAILVGLLAPWISSLITSMPPIFPTAIIMSMEGLTAVAIVSYLYHTKKWSFWWCLIIAVAAERMVLVLMSFIVAPLLKLPPEMFSLIKLVQSFPGVILQLILIPIILKALWKWKIVEQKS